MQLGTGLPENCCFEFEPKGLPKQGPCGPASLEEDGFDSLSASYEHRVKGHTYKVLMQWDVRPNQIASGER